MFRSLLALLLTLGATAASAQTVNIVGGIGAPEHAGFVTATVRLSTASSYVVTVDYATMDDSAKAGVNYTATSGTLMFNPGEIVKTVDISIIDNDVWGDSGRQFLFTISNATGGATLGDFTQIYAVLIEDDPEPTINVTGNTVAEGSGTRTIQLKLTLVGKTAKPATVALRRVIQPVNIGELNGLSVQPLSGATFNVGETEKFVDVSVTGNNTYDGAPANSWTIQWETFNVGAPGTPVTLVEDDPIPNVTVSDAMVVEGTSSSGTTLAHLAFMADAPVNGTIDYSLRPGTAAIGVDFLVPLANHGQIRWGGQTTMSIDVEIVPDAMPESNETFFVDFMSVQRMSLGATSAMVTIVDDDATPAARVDFVPSRLDLFAGQSATILATLSPPPAGDTPLSLQGAPWLMLPQTITIPTRGSVEFEVTAMDEGVAMVTAAPPPGSNIAVTPLMVDAASPEVIVIDPAGAPTGARTDVTVSGNGFSSMCVATFGGTAVPTRLIDSHTLVATTPAHGAGSVDVAVNCAAASVQAAQQFRFFDPRRRAARH